MIFVTVARLALPKDHDTLLRAVAEMRKSVPGAVLWIVGDGERRAALEKLGAELGLGESVKFWGERQNPGDFLRSADVFVLSSLSEGVPMSVLEAMAVGLPAIVSDVGGMAEVVRQADAGAVVPRSDVAGLAAAMRSFAADRAGARSTGAHAQAHYRNHFTLQCMADEYEKLYRQAMTK
jgi:glycosyltransferase involved in cell wall biosynthesis